MISYSSVLQSNNIVMHYHNKLCFLVVDEDLMNVVASRPRTLQPYVMETTEVKENLEK